MLASFRLAERLFDRQARRWAIVHAALRAVERVTIGLAALWLGTRGLEASAIASLAIVVSAGARGLSRLPLVAAVRTRLYAVTARGLLARDPLGAPTPPRDALDGGIVDALYAAETVFADLLPGLVGDAIAAALLAVIVAPFLPVRVVAVAIGALAIAGLFAELARRAAERAGQRSWDAFTPVADRLALCLHGARDVRGNGAIAGALERVRVATERYVAASRASDLVSGLAGRAPLVAAIVVVVGALAADEWLRGVPPARALEEVLVLAGTLPAFAGLFRGLVELGRARGPLAPLVSIVDAPPQSVASGALPALPAPISCEGLRWAYGDREVLADVRVRWSPGTLLAIAGPNGAGKSTLLGLLAGLAPPSAGTLRWGEIPLASIDESALRAEIAYLPQRPYLPPGATVGAAMRLVAPTASDERLTAELRRFDLWDRLVRRGCAPLEVPIDALSAGERQRIAIARVLARDTALLLLDEPDADLDAASVAVLVQRLRELSTSRMVAVVAHSPAIVSAADETVVLPSSA